MAVRTCGGCRYAEGFELTKHEPPRLKNKYGRCGYPLPALPMVFKLPEAVSVIWPNEDATKCPCFEPKESTDAQV